MSTEISTSTSTPTTLAALAALTAQANANALVTVDDKLFNDMTRNKSYLGRLQLYSKGKDVNHGLVMPGEFGIPDGENVIRLGKTIDIIPLARRPKALDMSDMDNIVSVYDPKDPEFIRIQAKAGEKDSKCMFGISFLVYERSSKRFLEYFAGTVTSRKEAGKIFPFLAPPTTMTLTSRVIDAKDFSWHGTVVSDCSTPIDLPDLEEVSKEITSFLNPKVEKVEKVAAETVAGRRAR